MLFLSGVINCWISIAKYLHYQRNLIIVLLKTECILTARCSSRTAKSGRRWRQRKWPQRGMTSSSRVGRPQCLAWYHTRQWPSGPVAVREPIVSTQRQCIVVKLLAFISWTTCGSLLSTTLCLRKKTWPFYYLLQERGKGSKAGTNGANEMARAYKYWGHNNGGLGSKTSHCVWIVKN